VLSRTYPIISSCNHILERTGTCSNRSVFLRQKKRRRDDRMNFISFQHHTATWRASQ
jgi:hypothetical protein